MPQEGGLASLLNAARSSSDRSSGQLQVFSLLEQACKPELVLGGTNEVLARALHQDYLESAGEKTDSDAAVAWEDLSAEMQEANRNEANHIAIKLKAAGLHLVPLTALEAEPFSFTPDEVEQLAMLEHDRWVKERTALGWTPGPRNAENKTNPNLVPWSELPEASREMNRASVRQLPTFLMRTGFTARKSG
ncbi:MAG TPA: RyR domain-containing protein, partial [Candidatus Limnocylindria bacterium]|nr:RyR domain-containing protein [Candidatus Limnocylindria bacterium]